MKPTAPTPDPLCDFSSVVEGVQPLLVRISQLRDAYRKQLADGKILPNVIEALRIESTYHSNAIEGSTLTLRQTQLVIEGTVPPGNVQMRELYEARNHDLALKMIEQWATEPRRGPLTEQDVLEIHKRVMTDVAPSFAGQFRWDRVLIAGSGYIPPSSRKFDELIPAMIGLANRSGIDPAILSAELHYNLVAIHPFNDGNGRTARLLMDYLLLRSGLPHVIVPVNRRAEYLAALDEANGGRLAPFTTFTLSVIEASLTRYIG